MSEAISYLTRYIIPTTQQEKKLVEEIEILRSEMVSEEAIQTAVLKAINELEAEKGEV